MNTSRPTLLVVDDDPSIRDLLANYLRPQGFEVFQAANGAEMDELLTGMRPDLILLDVMLPDGDGVAICRRLAGPHSPPIIMLTGKCENIDQVLGLEMGADDYVIKPFAPRTLLARIRAVIRRTSTPTSKHANNRLSFDKFIVDMDARQLFDANAAPVALTSGEFDLLAVFLRSPRRVLSRDQILDALPGRSADPYDRSVDMLVSRLRRKLGKVEGGSQIIGTVRNSGYLMTTMVTPVQ